MNAPHAPLPVASRWFVATPVGDGVTLISEPFVDEFLRANIWLVRGRERDLLVDSGNGIAPLLPAVRAVQDEPGKPLLAVATHAHSDHMGGLHEFEVRLVHRLEADAAARAADVACLVSADLPSSLTLQIAEDGVRLPDLLISALPREDFDPSRYRLVPATPTAVLDEGSTIDLGDREFAILHLPGHSPGSIGIWEATTGILFSGDAACRDGPLLDRLPGSDVDDYRTTMERLRGLPVSIVHAGHDPSFSRSELAKIAESYLASRGR